MKKLLIALIFAVTALGLPAVAADVLGIGTSARSIGLGRCYVGITDVGECVFGNPAGLQGLKRIEMASMYTELSGDVKYTIVGVSAPTAIGNVGFGYASNKIGDIFATTLDATGRPATLEPFSYGTDMLVLDYANSINSELKYGLRLKYIDKGGDIASAGRGNGFNLDAALSYKPDDNTRLGAVIENAIAGGPGAMKWDSGVEEEMPFVLNLGGSYRMDKLNTTIYTDVSLRKTMPFEMRAGAEWNAWGPLDLRAGLEQMNSSSSGKYINYSLGVGYKMPTFRVDYAYYIDTMLDYNSRHYVSFALSLPTGPEPPDVEKVGLEEVDYLGDISIFARNLGDQFEPGGYLTRAEFVMAMEKALLKRQLTTRERTSYSFYDVSLNNPAAPYILVAKEKNHVTGYPDGTFRPKRLLSRAEFVTMVETVFEEQMPGLKKEKPKYSFRDVPIGHWAERYVAAAKESGHILGYPDQKFKPGKKITKGEVMIILSRMKMEGAASEVGKVKAQAKAKAKAKVRPKAKVKAKAVKAKAVKAKAVKAKAKATVKPKVKKK